MSTTKHPQPTTLATTVPIRSDHPPAVRASDAEREDAVARLHQALGEGRLDLAETETRVAAAYAVTYRGELPPLLADLPDTTPGPSVAGAPAWQAIWSFVVWRVRDLLLGQSGTGSEPPGGKQRRAGVTIVVLAAVWFVLWAFVGAAVVA